MCDKCKANEAAIEMRQLAYNTVLRYGELFPNAKRGARERLAKAKASHRLHMKYAHGK